VGTQRRRFGPRSRARRGEGGRHKLLAFLKERVGEVVYGEELAAIAGIGEWARRIRELRVEHGYEITELGQSAYRLESVTPNEGEALRWRTLNGIRRQGGSASKRLLAMFEAFVGEVITPEDIAYVGKIPSAARRIRELRDEQGWPINSHIDERELRPGEYRLVSADPADRRDPRQRIYPEDLRERVFARDKYTCQICGRNREKALAAGDTRFYLEIHHKSAVAEELDALPPEELNKEENLVTLCHADHIEATAELQERRRQQRTAARGRRR
jgi:5-methylcytosine-specific restriction endonuclease McrA